MLAVTESICTVKMSFFFFFFLLVLVTDEARLFMLFFKVEENILHGGCGLVSSRTAHRELPFSSFHDPDSTHVKSFCFCFCYTRHSQRVLKAVYMYYLFKYGQK